MHFDQYPPHRIRAVRKSSVAISAPLSVEDMGAQAMEDASPTKRHLAHRTCFFSEFVLSDRTSIENYRNFFHPQQRCQMMGLHLAKDS